MNIDIISHDKENPGWWWYLIFSAVLLLLVLVVWGVSKFTVSLSSDVTHPPGLNRTYADSWTKQTKKHVEQTVWEPVLRSKTWFRSNTVPPNDIEKAQPEESKPGWMGLKLGKGQKEE